MVKKLGSEVNLGNIASNEVIGVETTRASGCAPTTMPQFHAVEVWNRRHEPDLQAEIRQARASPSRAQAPPEEHPLKQGPRPTLHRATTRHPRLAAPHASPPISADRAEALLHPCASRWATRSRRRRSKRFCGAGATVSTGSSKSRAVPKPWTHPRCCTTTMLALSLPPHPLRAGAASCPWAAGSLIAASSSRIAIADTSPETPSLQSRNTSPGSNASSPVVAVT